MSIDISLCRFTVVGAGRLGSALVRALRQAELTVSEPLRRDELPSSASDVVLLCVPDAEIAAVAQAIPAGPLLGHCAGAQTLNTLAPHQRRFSLHPLMTLSAGQVDPLRGAGAAVDGSDVGALEFAQELAQRLGMLPFHVAEVDRPAYHAAASIASNFLITLEGAAEELAASAGVAREMLLPLIQASVERWGALGAQRALTGPLVRGDDETVARQREAVAQRTPQLLATFDELCDLTRALAAVSA